MKSQASLPSVLLVTLCSLLFAEIASAGSATWNLNPANGNWNQAANWTPAQIPNGPGDVATFGVSNTTQISVAANADTEVDRIVFNAGASTYTITNSSTDGMFTISGAGVINNSGVTQNFLCPASLTGQNTPTVFRPGAVYACGVNPRQSTADSLAANGVTLASGTTLTLQAAGAGTISPGTVFTVINNTAATPITGTFSNLADGSTITIGNNTFQADYEGGDGNDLTLTVQ